MNAVKALDSAIVKLKYAPDGYMLATAGEDGTVFFFETAHDKYDWLDPICMIQLESGINDFTWNTSSTKILVACKNGRVYEINRPEKEKLDVKESFLVELETRYWQIKMMEFQMKKNQKKDEAELEKIKRMRLRGELPMEEEEEEDEDWDPEPIFTVKYTKDDTGRFIVTSGGLYIGYYYICQFDKERPQKAIDMPKNIECTYFDFSYSGDFLIAGCKNGSYYIWTNENDKKYMEVKTHDGHRGSIRSVKMNCKENYVLSVGDDGLLNVENINREAIKMYAQALVPGDDVDFITEMDGFETMETEQKVKARDDPSEDIVDPESLSIQEQKLRTEEYWRMKKAEERKAEIRNKILLLREEFEKLVNINLNEDQWIRLTEEDFNVDPEYFEMLANENEEKKQITKKEVAWGIEYRRVALEKLRSVFFDNLEYNRFTVKAIKTEAFVTTFRVKKMSKFLEENVRRYREMIEKEYHPQSGSDDDLQSIGSSHREEDEKRESNPTKTGMQGTTQFQNQGQKKKKKTEAELKREERTRAREERKRELERHEKEEGKFNQEDPKDLEQLEIAKNTYGDYKLKMSPDYIVPERERVNAEKKRQQMILLENSIFNLKVDFNKNLEDLKLKRKTEIIELAKESNQRILEINQELGIEEELFYPKIDEDLEYPENYYNIDMEDIIVFVHKKAKDSEVQTKSSMFGSSKKEEKQLTPEMIFAKEFEEQYRKEQREKGRVVDEHATNIAPERKTRQIPNETDVDIEMREIRRIELEYEKQQIKAHLESKITEFDNNITELQSEKYRLESDLRQAEMKLITFYEELIILNGMESRDKELTKSLAECRKEKGRIFKDIKDIKKEMSLKGKEIDEIREKKDNLMVEFHKLCPEGSPRYVEILQFFNRKMKARKRETADGDDEDGMDDDEFEEDEGEDDNDPTFNLNQDNNKIDDIEKLRDVRIDLDSQGEHIEKVIFQLENDRRKLETQEKTIDSTLEETEEMIQDFQKEKMDKLNQLKVSILLKISQIQNLEKNEAEYEKWEKYREENPPDYGVNYENMQMNGYNGTNRPGQGTTKGKDVNMSNNFGQDQMSLEDDYRGYFIPTLLKDSTLFSRDILLNLINRKRELDQQIAQNNITLDAQKREEKEISKEIKHHQAAKKQKEEEYNEKQMLRFGDIVDLDSLEVSGPSQVVLDLRNQQLRVEKNCMRKREEAEAELEQTQRELTKSVKENTGLLELIIALGKEQIEYNEKLNQTGNAILEGENEEQKKQIIREKEELREFIQMQSRKIETLKTEINLYKRKGGHIYTKVTTNRRNNER